MARKPYVVAVDVYKRQDIYRGKGISRGNAAYQVVKAYQFAALTILRCKLRKQRQQAKSQITVSYTHLDVYKRQV